MHAIIYFAYICIGITNIMIVNTTVKPILRFRRWSRKSYAMFLSMGKCVTIGYLKKSVIEASLNKQQAPTSYTYIHQEDLDISAEEESGSLSGVLQIPLFLAILPQSLHTVSFYGASEPVKQNNQYNRRSEPDEYVNCIYPAHFNFLYKNS